VLDQGYENLEYLVVDGGSSDETLEVIRRYEDRIDWWVSERDEGQTDAINKGLERASGDVIAYLNSDDYYLPGAFEKAIEALEESGAGWVAGAAINVDPEGRPGAWDTGDEWIPKPPQSTERRPRGRQWWIATNWSVPQPATFWRRALFDRHGGFRRDLHFALDVEFMERLALNGDLPVLVDDFLAARVLHPEAKSSDNARWRPEYRALRRSLRGALTPRERALLPYARLAHWAKTSPRVGWFRFRLIHPLLRAGGRLIGLLPEPIRPRIRTRDRRRSRG
jgi:glycosyltransferase involved in cell wall biosynthesis